jgi:hypothetical protein
MSYVITHTCIIWKTNIIFITCPITITTICHTIAIVLPITFTCFVAPFITCACTTISYLVTVTSKVILSAITITARISMTSTITSTSMYVTFIITTTRSVIILYITSLVWEIVFYFVIYLFYNFVI